MRAGVWMLMVQLHGAASRVSDTHYRPVRRRKAFQVAKDMPEFVMRGSDAFNMTIWRSLKHVEHLLERTKCVRDTNIGCQAGRTPPSYSSVSGLDVTSRPPSVKKYKNAVAHARTRAKYQELTIRHMRANPDICRYQCYHGAYMIPWLIRHYRVRSVIELGVCSGMSTANVIEHFGPDEGLTKYYAVDPWSEPKCDPGCGCADELRLMALAWRSVVVPLRGFSTEVSGQFADSSIDLVYVDAAHDYRSVRADILAYWPKLKPNGIMAGHDFEHWLNFAEVRQDMELQRGGWNLSSHKLPARAYGVVQATQELFSSCQVHVMFGTWWVERTQCPQPWKVVKERDL